MGGKGAGGRGTGGGGGGQGEGSANKNGPRGFLPNDTHISERSGNGFQVVVVTETQLQPILGIKIDRCR